MKLQIKIFSCLALWCLSCVFINAQGQTAVSGDTTVLLKTAVVSSERITHFGSGIKYEEIDSTGFIVNQSGSLADLLANQSSVFIKRFSGGGLSTPSLRGTGAGHTAVLWNGFNISSPMNGLVDFNLIPTDLVNSITVQHGGSSALWGSGAIGGVIHLQNLPEYNKGFTYGAGYTHGSFDNKRGNLKLGYSNEKVSSSTRLFLIDATNNYPYKNIAQFGEPVEELSNAEVKQYGLMHEDYFRLGNDNLLGVSFWYQQNDRNIPPSMTVNKSTANQKDDTFRSSLKWLKSTKKGTVEARAAYFDEALTYNDPSISTDTKSEIKKVISEVVLKHSVSKRKVINIGLNGVHSQAKSENFAEEPTQQRVALFTSLNLKSKSTRREATISIRQEYISNGTYPLTGSFGFQNSFSKQTKLKGRISRDYKVPTFNQLFWTPGGNPDLLPESSWNGETGIVWNKENEKMTLNLEGTIYNSIVDNWIIWLPGNSGIWSPENIISVWSRGGEFSASFIDKYGPVRNRITSGFSYTLSTNYKVASDAQQTLEKQLIYVPRQQAFLNLGTEYKAWSIIATYQVVGQRYTTSDNNSVLDAYQTLDARIGKSYKLGAINVNVFFKANNILNAEYQVIAFYPMMGRNYRVGIMINSNPKYKSKS